MLSNNAHAAFHNVGGDAMIRSFLIAGAATIFTTLTAAPAAVAQDYPKKPIWKYIRGRLSQLRRGFPRK
jgi:ABC-type spermidine/putrescine transport system permease subunit II